jgi:hypothetical protein
MPAPPHPRPCNHRHPGRSGNLYGVRRGRSASRRPARLRIPARCCPTGFSTPYPRSAVFRTSRIHFPRRSTCGESHGANAETAAQSLPDTGRNPDFNAWLETLAHACGVSASEAVVGTWSILYPYPWLGRPDFYRSGLPQANARGLFRGHDPKQVLCKCKTNVDAFRKSVRYCCLNKLRNQPEPSQRKKRRKKKT